MVKIIPETKLGKISLILQLVMPLLFVLGGSLTNTLYKGVAAGNSIGGDLAARPFLAVSMFLGLLAGLAAFVLAIYVVWKKKERALLIFIPIIIGAQLLFFLVGEFLFPH